MEPTAPTQPQPPVIPGTETPTINPSVNQDLSQRFERRGEILKKAQAEFKTPEGGTLTPQQERNIAIVLMEKATEIFTKIKADAASGTAPDSEALDTALIFSGYSKTVLENLRDSEKTAAIRAPQTQSVAA